MIILYDYDYRHHFFFFLSLLPSFLGFISSPPFQRDRAGQREKKARLPLKLASEHEAWILSFFPAKYALHFSPACPISRGGEGWLSQDRCETQTRRQPRGYRPKVAHPAECPPTVASLTQLLSPPPKQRVAVRVWSECVRVRAHPSVHLCVYV